MSKALYDLLHNLQQELKAAHSRYVKIEDIFLTSIIKKNAFIIYAGAILNLVFQLFNIARVFASNNKLQSMNNRIFFTFYITLFIVATTALIIRNRWPKDSQARYYLQLSSVIFYIYWNLFLNSYSIHVTPSSSKIVYISALIFSSILLRFKLLDIFLVVLSSGIVFLGINQNSLSSGDWINIVISIIATLLCTGILYLQELHMIQNRQQLLDMNTELKNREDSLRLGLERHQFIMEETNLFSFDWDLKKDILIPSRNCAETLNLPTYISNPTMWFQHRDHIFKADQQLYVELMESCVRDRKRGTVDLRIKDKSMNYTWYRLHLFIQLDHTNTTTLAIGVLLNIDGSTRLIHNLNKQLSTQIEGTKQHLEQLKDEQEQTKIYRHDIRHSLKLMEQLAAEGNLKKLCTYLAETQNKLETITPNHYCENEIVNLILGSFEQLAQKQSITFVTDVILPQDLPLGDTELCSLLFNLLENAVTAAGTSSDEALRFVKIRSAYNNHKLLIFTQNGYSGDITLEDDLPVRTTSESSEDHGFGIKSIVSIVEAHDGLYTFEINDQHFDARIMLEL